MKNPAALSVLRQSPLFGKVPIDLLLQIEALCRNRSYRRGEKVFEEGTPGNKLFGVIAGKLVITTNSADSSQLYLNVAESGEIVGEIAFLDGGLRTATGRAAEPSTCFELERGAFFELLNRAPQLSALLLQLVCKRVRWMTKLVADSAGLSVPDRLAARLKDLAGAGTLRNPEIHISQAELAQYLGISRQVVNGYLRAWQKQGRLELTRGTIRLKSVEALN